MNIAYLDTHSGIAGDMLLAAFVDAGCDQGYLQRQIDSLQLGPVELRFSETIRHAFRAKRLDIQHPPEHVHRNLADILEILERSGLESRERETAARIFRKLGAAEARVHGTSIDEVHFHEVGAIDSIVDIVGVSIALHALQIRRLVASPTPVGYGQIRIAHGAVSIPAPATAELLRGIPIRASAIEAELTTPTGAAVLATLADSFGPVPSMQLQRVGYGAGHRDLKEQANVLRVLIGTTADNAAEQITVLETNLDNVSGEEIGFAIERLWELGALDVYTTAISMKKNRPAIILSVICRPEQRVALEECILQHTSTLGVRRMQMLRRALPRELLRVETTLGEVRVKLSWRPGEHGVTPLIAPEYEDCRRLALASSQPLRAVMRIVQHAAERVVAELAPPAADTFQDEQQVAWESTWTTTDTVAHHHRDPTGHDHHHHHDHHHDHHDHHDHHHHDHDHHDH
jgi:pyridinium-3,5-bisthiocarboxylic acid mononucleotide nickel chelatase